MTVIFQGLIKRIKHENSKALAGRQKGRRVKDERERSVGARTTGLKGETAAFPMGSPSPEAVVKSTLIAVFNHPVLSCYYDTFCAIVPGNDCGYGDHRLSG